MPPLPTVSLEGIALFIGILSDSKTVLSCFAPNGEDGETPLAAATLAICGRGGLLMPWGLISGAPSCC